VAVAGSIGRLTQSGVAAGSALRSVGLWRVTNTWRKCIYNGYVAVADDGDPSYIMTISTILDDDVV